MNLTAYFKRFTSIDLLLFSYIFITFAFILAFYSKIPFAGFHLLFRLIFLLVILFLPLSDRFLNNTVVYFFRIAYPLIVLAFFYSETDALNNVFFQDLDYHFARFDSIIFGFQPSLAFSDTFPGRFFSEIMNFGYFSYYFIIASFVIYIFLNDKSAFIKSVFYITCSFLIYYIIFIILPVSGPQYFFKPPYNQVPDSGMFRSLVKVAEYIGERPTAAFPSSHVGIVLILMFMAWPRYLTTWYCLIPLFLLLSLSTIYVKAHYAMDVIGGILTAPLVFWLSGKIFIIFNKRDCNFI